MTVLKASDPRCSDTCPQCGKPKYRYSIWCVKCRGSSRRGTTDPRFLPSLVPDEVEIAWAAGFYEGEGSVGFHAGTLRVSIAQNEVWCLERIKRFFGGSIRPPSGRAPSGAPSKCSMLSMNGKLAEEFLLTILDHLSPRRHAQYVAALEKRSEYRGEVVPDDA